ncbi:MAG: PEP-CTERM sorting domain-containing protein [Cyanobacteria bacterium P01_C01_bin.72]
MQLPSKFLFIFLSVILLGFTPAEETKKTFFQGLGNLRKVDSGKPLSVFAISDDGFVVAGSRSSRNIVSGEFIVSEAFIWNNLTNESTSLTNSKVLSNNLIFDYATALSAEGKFVVGNRTGREAFIWSKASGMVDLGYLPGGDLNSSATSISADGSTVVGQSSSENGREAFIWNKADGMVGLGDLSGGDFASSAASISADGSTVVGQSSSENGREAFIWNEANGMVSLGDLPGGQFASQSHDVSAGGKIVVGQGKPSTKNPEMAFFETEAFIWNKANGMVGLGDLSGGQFASIAYAVSAGGKIVVGQGKPSTKNPEMAFFETEAFIWNKANGMVGLGDLPGGQFASIAYAVSANGDIVVGKSHTDMGWEAFIWQKEKGMRVLKDLLENEYGLNLTSWILEEALDISADGLTIVGTGYNPENKEEAWIVRLGEF